MIESVPCMLMRGGTSKGAYFDSRDLPDDRDERDDLILRVVGSPDPRQIDGIGGAHVLTTKVAVVGPPTVPDVDVDYLFLQPSVEEPLVSDAQNCGNMLAGVGPFAVERGMVAPAGNEARVCIHMVNTGSVATATFPLRNGSPDYSGRTSIDGVPGTAATIRLDFEDVAGGSCGALLPTGNLSDSVEGVDCTLIDNGMPTVVMRAGDLGVTGYEDCAVLEADDGLRDRLEEVRKAAGPLMGLGDVTHSIVPKMSLVAPPRTVAGDLSTRTFIPHRCHEAIGVLGAVSVATAVVLPGAVGHEMLRARSGGEAGPVEAFRIDRVVTLEHPSGTFDAAVTITTRPGETPTVEGAGIVRTARKLFDGAVFPRPR
ncbi:MAG: 4-oxalomesaconate tautomerase [Acidimicrobiaceae bacterium]|nr:4-oxalomesaconate tautomerase [Acidimicrobiaceae bacterium]